MEHAEMLSGRLPALFFQRHIIEGLTQGGIKE